MLLAAVLLPCALCASADHTSARARLALCMRPRPESDLVRRSLHDTHARAAPARVELRLELLARAVARHPAAVRAWRVRECRAAPCPTSCPRSASSALHPRAKPRPPGGAARLRSPSPHTRHPRLREGERALTHSSAARGSAAARSGRGASARAARAYARRAAVRGRRARNTREPHACQSCPREPYRPLGICVPPDSVDEAAFAHCTPLMTPALARGASDLRALWTHHVQCSLLALCAPALWLPPNAPLADDVVLGLLPVLRGDAPYSTALGRARPPLRSTKPAPSSAHALPRTRSLPHWIQPAPATVPRQDLQPRPGSTATTPHASVRRCARAPTPPRFTATAVNR
jgi:hypothetical protein